MPVGVTRGEIEHGKIRKRIQKYNLLQRCLHLWVVNSPLVQRGARGTVFVTTFSIKAQATGSKMDEEF